jgi:hypothetical protein
VNAAPWLQLGRMALALPHFLSRPLSPAAALATVRGRFEARETRFLETVRRLVFENPRSPYLDLLAAARCTYAELERGVRRDGLERTLAALRDAGVRVPLAVLKERAREFDNPSFDGARIDGATSGSRTPAAGGTRVGYDWALIEEQAATELVLNELHGTTGHALVLWLPPLPSIAGMQSVLANLKWGRVPAAWFSPVDPRGGRLAARHRLANAYLLGMCRVLGRAVPRPVRAGFDDAEAVARAAAARRPCVVRTYVSSAVRLARAARAAGLRLDGCTILCGGEPLTEARRTFIEETGARVFPRYSATEAGQIGASCPQRAAADDMHVYLDRVALIGDGDGDRDREADRDAGRDASGGGDAQALLLTTLSPHSGKVLLNADIGDRGRLARRPCACALGRMGMELHVEHVRSAVKVTAEGMNLLVSEIDEALAAVVAAAGGSPDDYQFREVTGRDGLAALEVVIDPEVPRLGDEGAFREALLGRLTAGRPAAALADAVWTAARTVRLVRERPRLSRGHKLPRVVGPPR